VALASVEALGGYLLEEVLAYLLRSNGYRLLETATEDEQSLRDASNGLRVRGRGAEHQADVLGELLMPSPFSLPVRLFVEGKHRRRKTSLQDVRNAHGVIADVNEHYSAEQSLFYRQPLRRYLYRYALFSTSGFVPRAQSFALAHQISLIDLSGPAFEPLVEVLNEAASSLHAEASDLKLQTFPIRKVRLALRAALAAVESETATAEDGGERVISPEAAAADAVADMAGGVPASDLASWAAVFAASLNASASGEGLILGFPPAPFILAMRPDSLSDFERYVDDHGPDIDVSIGFDGTDATEGDWVIEPRDHPEAFRLSFGLPGALETWLLSAPDGAAARANAAKRELLSVISLFLEDRLVRLRFRPREVPAVAVQQREMAAQGLQVSAEASNASDLSYLRRTLKPLRPKPAVRDLLSVPDVEFHGDDAEYTGWSVAAVAALMEELDGYGYVQADLLREAARNGGLLSRDDVYRVADFSSNRSLRGLTRPPRRITGVLIRNKMLPQDAAYPLQTRYESGVRATHFVVPPDVVDALRRLGPPSGI
jgi:hypothetical protein